VPITKIAQREIDNAFGKVKDIYQNPTIPKADQKRKLKKLYPTFSQEVGKQLGVPSNKAYTEAVRRGYIK
jgi:hypothetical protein